MAWGTGGGTSLSNFIIQKLNCFSSRQSPSGAAFLVWGWESLQPLQLPRNVFLKLAWHVLFTRHALSACWLCPHPSLYSVSAWPVYLTCSDRLTTDITTFWLHNWLQVSPNKGKWIVWAFEMKREMWDSLLPCPPLRLWVQLLTSHSCISHCSVLLNLFKLNVKAWRAPPAHVSEGGFLEVCAILPSPVFHFHRGFWAIWFQFIFISVNCGSTFPKAFPSLFLFSMWRLLFFPPGLLA